MAAALLTRPILFPVREDAVLLEWPEASEGEANREAVALGRKLRAWKAAGVLDAVPGARSLLVVLDPARLPATEFSRLLETRAAGAAGEAFEEPRRILRIAAVYDGEDLGGLAAERGFSAEEFARRHAAARYRVAFVGFAPGFAYLEGLPADLAAPRLESPRPRVPGGSLAIGGSWTGVYPAASPGGWRLIGRTSVRLFDASAEPPSLLSPGDFVEFERVPGLPAPVEPLRASSLERPVFRVLAPGLLTTIQGAPRYGLGSSGVPAGGAMDLRSLARANALVGNSAGAPALEATLAGPELELLEDSVLAAAGALCAVERNGRAAPFDEAFEAAAGDRIRIGRVGRGARVYLARRGGLEGKARRRLEDGNLVGAAERPFSGGSPPVPPSATPTDGEIRVRAVPGPEASGFSREDAHRFYAASWRVRAESDRRGLRLEGRPITGMGTAEIAPSGTVAGTIQVPGGGLPIVLGPDGPVTGGYPRLATVIGADLPLLGQARPGTLLRFELVPLETALAARLAGSTMGSP